MVLTTNNGVKIKHGYLPVRNDATWRDPTTWRLPDKADRVYNILNFEGVELNQGWHNILFISEPVNFI